MPRKRVHRELRDRLVRPRVGFVIEDVHRAVSDLEKINVSSDGARTFFGWRTV
jgi:hypothetical protein